MDFSQVEKPVFPPEIWPTVFSNLRQHHDVIHLWSDCRHVCTQFRHDVEHCFITKHLTKTTITFDCGVWYNREAFGGKVDLRSISFNFDRLANEGQTDIFKIEDCAEEYMSEIMHRVTCCIGISSMRFERPAHLVFFRQAENDAEVPEVAADEKPREISFNWRAMFSVFCAEAKLQSYYMKNYRSSLITLNILHNSLLTWSVI